MKTKLVRVSDSGMTTSEDLSKLLTLLSELITLVLCGHSNLILIQRVLHTCILCMATSPDEGGNED